MQRRRHIKKVLTTADIKTAENVHNKNIVRRVVNKPFNGTPNLPLNQYPKVPVSNAAPPQRSNF